MDQISNLTVESSENVKGGNQDIREVRQYHALYIIHTFSKNTSIMAFIGYQEQGKLQTLDSACHSGLRFCTPVPGLVQLAAVESCCLFIQTHSSWQPAPTWR